MPSPQRISGGGGVPFSSISLSFDLKQYTLAYAHTPFRANAKCPTLSDEKLHTVYQIMLTIHSRKRMINP